MSQSLTYHPICTLEDIPGGVDFIHDGLNSLYASTVGAMTCHACKKILTIGEIQAFYPQYSGIENRTLQSIFGNSSENFDEHRELPKNLQHFGCGGTLEWIYGGHLYRKKISAILEGRRFFGTILIDSGGNFCGIAFGYLGSLQDAYDNDLSYHFSQIGLSSIKSGIFRALGQIPHKFIHIHMIGTLASFRSKDILYRLMKSFAGSFPSGSHPGLCEVNDGSLTETVVSRGIQGKKVFPTSTTNLLDIGPRHPGYNPKIYLIPDIRERAAQIITSKEIFYQSLT